MALVMQCDRCKKIFDHHKGGYRGIYVKYKKDDQDYPSKNIYKELCPECIKYIVTYIQEEKE
jgi:hypothetical protein